MNSKHESTEVKILTVKNFQETIEQIETLTTRTIFLVTLGTLLVLFKEGLVIPYDYNRSGKISRKRINEIAKNFNANGFGAVHVCTRDGVLELVDAHHRMEALSVINDDLVQFSDSLSQEMVPLIIVASKDRLTTYQTLNAGKSHSGTEKINNPELAVGSYVHEIKNAASASDLNPGLSQNMIDVVVSFEDSGSNFSMDDVLKNRNKVNSLLDMAKDRRTWSLKEETVNKAIKAVQKYKSVLNYANSEQEYDTADMSKLLKSPGFFLTFISDHMSYNSQKSLFCGFSHNPNKDILNKLTKGGKESRNRFSKIVRATRTIARRDTKEMEIGLLRNLLG